MALRDRGAAFGAHDGTWITIASTLEHAAAGSEVAEMLVREAVAAAGSVLTEPVARRAHCLFMPAVQQGSDAEVIHLLAEELEEAGALNLGLLILEAFAAAVPSLARLDAGRIVAHRARILARMGELDRADDTYRQVIRLAGEYGEPELKVLAWIGYGAISQLRGDYAAVRRWSAGIVRLTAGLGQRRLARHGHTGLFLAAAATGKYDVALVHGWKAYELTGSDTLAAAELLSNLGQLLLDAGHAASSRAAFAAVLSTLQPARIGLAALGGFSVASAKVGHKADVHWAVAEMDREAERTNHPFSTATAFLDCAAGLLAIGDSLASAKYRDLALSICQRHGYHGIATQAQRLAVPEPRALVFSMPLSVRAVKVVRQIERLEPDALPAHVSFVRAA